MWTPNSENKAEHLVKGRMTLSRLLSLPFFLPETNKKIQDNIIFNICHVQVLNGIGTSEKKLGWVEAMTENEKFNRIGNVYVKPRLAFPQKLHDFEQD